MEKIFKIKNGMAQVTIEDDELYIDIIKVEKRRQGIGAKLMNTIKQYAAENSLIITLYAEPQDNSITQEELCNFYYSCGFDLHHDDIDGSLFTR